MERIIEAIFITLAVAVAAAWLAKRFLLKDKRGCAGPSGCGCAKPSLPKHIKAKD